MFDKENGRLPFSCIILSLFTVIRCDDCTTISACVCQFQNGSRVDITTLGNTDGTPKFFNVRATSLNNSTYSYSYNPCHSFSLPSCDSCKDVAACQMTNTGDSYVSLGRQDSAKFYLKDSQLFVNYSTNKRTTTVKLVCDGVEDFSVTGEVVDISYSFTYRTSCACANRCMGAIGPDNLSTGSVLVILLFTFTLLYLLGGIVFKKIIVGATGKELIPNYEFWMDFPLLVRDGVVFVCNGCQNEASYDRI